MQNTPITESEVKASVELLQAIRKQAKFSRIGCAEATKTVTANLDRILAYA